MIASTELQQLLARVALGDRAAFQRFYDATAPSLFGVALRIVRQPDRAPEMLQDAFVNVCISSRVAAVRQSKLAHSAAWAASANTAAPNPNCNSRKRTSPVPLLRLAAAHALVELRKKLAGDFLGHAIDQA
jgi:DNA-directed RNA polymerase specialized sigma24 family protein